MSELDTLSRKKVGLYLKVEINVWRQQPVFVSNIKQRFTDVFAKLKTAFEKIKRRMFAVSS